MDSVVQDETANQWVKIWFDTHQYRVIDTCSTSTVAEMRRAMTTRTGVIESTFEMLLELSLSNGDKSIRKMDENEYIQQVLDKNKNYAIRLMWVPASGKSSPSSDTKSENTKYRAPPSRWSEVFKSVDNSIQLMKENYQSLPSHWLSIFKSLDAALASEGQSTINQSEMKYLISKCAAILLSIPSKPKEPTSPYFTDKGRPKSLELFSSSNGLDRAALDNSLRRFEQEISALKENVQSRNLLTPTELLQKQQTEVETDDEDSAPTIAEKLKGERITTKSRIPEKFNQLTLDTSQSPTISSFSPSGFVPFTPKTPHTPSIYATPRIVPQTPKTPQTPQTPTTASSSSSSSSSSSFSSFSSIFRVPNLTRGRATSVSTPCTPVVKYKPAPPQEKLGPDPNEVLRVLYQALQDHRQLLGEESDEEDQN